MEQVELWRDFAVGLLMIAGLATVAGVTFYWGGRRAWAFTATVPSRLDTPRYWVRLTLDLVRGQVSKNHES